MKAEAKLHAAISDYIKLVYPKIYFISEQSGLFASYGVAKNLKRTRSDHRHLDLYLLEPRKGFHGLILELKAKDIYQKKNPELFLKSDHINDQAKTIKELNKKGYLATFAIKFDEAKKIIDNYLND